MYNTAVLSQLEEEPVRVEILFFPTGELSGRGHVSQRETEIAEILVATVVDRCEVLPLLNGAGQVHRIQRDLQLACWGGR